MGSLEKGSLLGSDCAGAAILAAGGALVASAGWAALVVESPGAGALAFCARAERLRAVERPMIRNNVRMDFINFTVLVVVASVFRISFLHQSFNDRVLFISGELQGPLGGRGATRVPEGASVPDVHR